VKFEALTDAEITRWAAERDGWTPTTFCRTCGKTSEGHIRLDCDGLKVCNELYEQPPAYATSADAAIALAERWGYKIVLVGQTLDRWMAGVSNPATAESSYEFADTPARALLNCICAAKAMQEGGA
jgi:hypothetical protein